jgi:hypothetical protein
MSKQYFTTPYGTAIFPWLNRADTEYNKAGVFHVKISVPLEEATDFIKGLEEQAEAKFDELTPAQQKNWAIAPVYDEEYDEDGEPTGNVIFKTKMTHNVTYTNKAGEKESFTQTPEIVDADGNTLRESVWAGSVLRARGQVIPYAMASSKTVGVSLRLSGVQVRELVTGSQQGGWGDDGGTIPGQAR